MDNTDSSTQKEQNRKQEELYLPDFFQKDFPNLSEFLKENLTNNYKRRIDRC